MKDQLKKMWDNINKVSFWLCFVLSASFLIAGFIVPPLGEISPSVLTAVGELFAFGSLGTVIYGIEKGSDISLKKGNVELKLDNPDKPNQNK